MLVLTGSAGHASATGSAGLRILYASDWTGPTEIFAADPSGRTPVLQVTFARPESQCDQYSAAEACGYTRPQPSPDGRWLAYWSVAPGIPVGTAPPAFYEATLWLARADGMNARPIGLGYDADWSPDSRSLAYSAEDGIHVVTAAGVDRLAYRRANRDYWLDEMPRWSPDGRTIAFVNQNGLSLLRDGRVHLLATDYPPKSLAWSPDGRQIAYATSSSNPPSAAIDFVATTGRAAVRVVQLDAGSAYRVANLGIAFSPNGRLLAFHEGGRVGVGRVGFVNTRSLRVRTVRIDARDIAWAPDSTRLLIVRGTEEAYEYAITTSDVQTITPSGHIQTVISASAAYGGQIVSAAWTTPAAGITYSRPQQVTGLFAGGPVSRLVTDGDRLAFVACGALSSGELTTGTVDPIVESEVCWTPSDRPAHIGSLALAGDRLLWWTADLALGFEWSMRETEFGATPIQVATGNGALGATPAVGAGTAVGSGSLLVMSNWRLHYHGGRVVDQQTILRVDPGGCPCPPISSSPGPYVPLDVDENRIVASGNNETRILAANGTILLSLPVPTLAAQLSGSQLVLAAGSSLRVYDAASGELKATWPLPSEPASHDCDGYDDPSCSRRTITLEDIAHGLAAYILDGQVHLLRLSDGADRTVAAGSLARFTNTGLVYADGARIWLTRYDQLPLN